MGNWAERTKTFKNMYCKDLFAEVFVVDQKYLGNE